MTMIATFVLIFEVVSSVFSQIGEPLGGLVKWVWV